MNNKFNIKKGDFLKYVKEPKRSDWIGIGEVSIELKKGKIYEVSRFYDNQGREIASVTLLLENGLESDWYPTTMFRSTNKINNI